MQYNFEWNMEKAKTNIRKHKISFEQAATIFRDPRAISIYERIEHLKVIFVKYAFILSHPCGYATGGFGSRLRRVRKGGKTL